MPARHTPSAEMNAPDVPARRSPSRAAWVGWGIAAVVLDVCVVWLWGYSAQGLVLAVLCALLAVAAAFDASARRIPNAVVAAILALWVVWIAVDTLAFDAQFWPLVASSLLGALAAAGPVALLTAIARARGSLGFGMGDSQLRLAAGLFFTWWASLLALVVACVVGAGIGIVLRVKSGERKLPFGCGICVGWWTIILAVSLLGAMGL